MYPYHVPKPKPGAEKNEMNNNGLYPQKAHSYRESDMKTVSTTMPGKRSDREHTNDYLNAEEIFFIIIFNLVLSDKYFQMVQESFLDERICI